MQPDPKTQKEIEDLSAVCKATLAQTSGELRLAGLKEPVEVLRDRWGIPHIYAKNPDDLFFAQGFVQAQDRLWQMEIWRRTAEGRLAEIVGPAAVERDRIARLTRYRGDMETEWKSYSPDAKQITEAFVRGVNAFIELCRDHPPIEFQLTGIKPEPWTPEVCLGRMAGLIMCRNAGAEVLRAQLVRELGPEQAAQLLPTDPLREIKLPDGLALDGIDERLSAVLNSVTGPIRIPLRPADSSPPTPLPRGQRGEGGDEGSNNWIVAGRLTATGKPVLANDPHRPITLPSLRYVVHLVCPPSGSDPGWNVIGGTEPALPGVTIGHNERVGWGLTIVGTDQQDLYVEETDPGNPNRYRVGDEWQPMQVERESLHVRGEPEPRTLEIKFTRHGPVIFEDRERSRAYALRWTGSEPGTAGYLAALALDRVQNWPEFLEAADRWKLPSENLVYADVDGHIGWIAAALTPNRRGWDGLLPVPGAGGKFEWDGWLPTTELPQRFDPPEGFIATANHNILPPGYPHTISFEWAAPFRFERIDQVLLRGVAQAASRARFRFDIDAFKQLQHDATSIPAQRLLALLRGVKIDDESLRGSAEMLLGWDAVLSGDSGAAALFELWQIKLAERVLKSRVPKKLWIGYSGRLPFQAMVALLEHPDSTFGRNPQAGRDAALLDALRDATAELGQRLGAEPSKWEWGKLHQAHFAHMLEAAAPSGQKKPKDGDEQLETDGQEIGGDADEAASPSVAVLAAVLNLAPVSRDGDAFTPLAAGGPSFGNFDQTTGASYRHILDLADWDRSVATSVPGQSGQPGSPHYGDLLSLWAEGKYFPLLFSRWAIESATTEKHVLLPDSRGARNED